MKLRVENTKLKSLINEATYQDVVSQMKKGDTLVVKSGKGVYKPKVVDVFGNQVTLEHNGNRFIITPSSLDGTDMYTNVMVTKDGEQVAAKGPTIKGIYHIRLERGGKTVAGVTFDEGMPEPDVKKAKKKKNIYQARFEELSRSIKGISEGEIMVVTTGSLVTKGKDKGSLKEGSIAELKFYVQKKVRDMIMLKLYEVEGKDTKEYEEMKKYILTYSPESLTVTEEGVTLYLKYKDEEGKLGKVKIDNIFSIDSGGEFDKMPDVDIEALMQSPRMRKIMYKNPSLLDKLLGRGAKGIIPLQQQLKDLGLGKSMKKGNKVKFRYEGENIRPEYRFNFTNGDTYIGKFTKQDVIKRTGDNRRESMYIKLLEKVGENKYKVDVMYDKIIDGKTNPKKVGEGIIKILGRNY